MDQRLAEISRHQSDMGQRQSDAGNLLADMGQRQSDAGNLLADMGQRQSDMDQRLAEMLQRQSESYEYLRKIETRQKEASLQFDAISDSLQDGAQPYIAALVELADSVEGFYRYAADGESPALFGQAQMMWGAAKNSLASVGVMAIENDGQPFDPMFETAESTGAYGGMPDGYVLKTLKCGYAYDGKLLRRASVVVNKTGADTDTGADTGVDTGVDTGAGSGAAAEPVVDTLEGA